MKQPDAQPAPFVEGKPPIFRTWNQLYVFVLVLHIFIVILFYWFKIAYA